MYTEKENLDHDLILNALPPILSSAVNPIQVFAQLPSTNSWLLQHGQHGDVCLAELQTSGRGRRGRAWQSPAGMNIYLSLRWHFPSLPKALPMLSLVTGLAVAEALAQQGINGHGVKWPNDIYAKGKKLGGILLEAVGALQQVVLGIGLNVNMLADDQQAIDQPWVSLRMLQGQKVDRNLLVAQILTQLIPRLQAFTSLDMAQFYHDWQSWDLLYQQLVRVVSGTDTWEGIALGVDNQGLLRVRLQDGSIHVFSSADVSVRM